MPACLTWLFSTTEFSTKLISWQVLDNHITIWIGNWYILILVYGTHVSWFGVCRCSRACRFLWCYPVVGVSSCPRPPARRATLTMTSPRPNVHEPPRATPDTARRPSLPAGQPLYIAHHWLIYTDNTKLTFNKATKSQPYIMVRSH